MADSDAPRLVYQIEVTAPGTKSQGWHGTLFDKTGKPMQVAPGKTVHTNIGDFLSVARKEPQIWEPYGMIHVDQVAWMKTHNGNEVMDSEPWVYRLFVALEGSKSEGWRGEILHGRGVIGPPADDRPQPTPMGPYRWLRGKEPWQPTGWFHVSWSTVSASKAA